MSRTNAGNLPTSRHTAAASHSSDSSSSRTASPRRAYAATLRALGDTKANSTVAHFCCPFVATVVTGTAILLHFFRTPADTFSTDQPPYPHHGKIEALLQMLWLTGNSFVLALEGADDDVGLIGHYEFCTESSYELYPLWILNHIISFAAQNEHNDIVTGIFDTLVGAIGTEIDETRPTQLHFSVSALLKKIRLLLPYHIYPPDTVIPKLEGNFFKNILKIREHRLDLYSYKAPSGIPRKISVFLHSRHIIRSGCFIVLPLLVYSAATMLHTMAVLPTAVLGLIIADSLWTLVLRTNSTAPRYTSAHNFSCSNQDNVYPDLSGPAIKHPALAVRSTVRALRTKDWHKKRIYWGQWRTSLSQVFYRLLLLFYYCGERGDASFLKEQVATIQSDVADFSESFGC
ncbi:hypothetical protein HPB50_029112 [Hyalomma asiaticum]|nr:hypothetical protein HPB50_029112 [Hyalomma asiaticum]